MRCQASQQVRSTWARKYAAHRRSPWYARRPVEQCETFALRPPCARRAPAVRARSGVVVGGGAGHYQERLVAVDVLLGQALKGVAPAAQRGAAGPRCVPRDQGRYAAGQRLHKGARRRRTREHREERARGRHWRAKCGPALVATNSLHELQTSVPRTPPTGGAGFVESPK